MREILIINAVCLLIAAGALGVAVWALITGQVEVQGIDGLFLIFLCLLIALAFSINPLYEFRKGALRNLVKRSQILATDRQERAVAEGASGEAQEKR